MRTQKPREDHQWSEGAQSKCSCIWTIPWGSECPAGQLLCQPSFPCLHIWFCLSQHWASQRWAPFGVLPAVLSCSSTLSPAHGTDVADMRHNMFAWIHTCIHLFIQLIFRGTCYVLSILLRTEDVGKNRADAPTLLSKNLQSNWCNQHEPHKVVIIILILYIERLADAVMQGIKLYKSLTWSL